MKRHQYLPFGCGVFLGGIILFSSKAPLSVSFILPIALGAVMRIALKDKFILFVIACACISAFFIVRHQEKQMRATMNPVEIELEAYITAQEFPNTAQQKLVAEIEDSSDKNLLDEKISIKAYKYPLAPKGSKIKVRCSLEIPEAFDGFNYPRYLASKRIYFLCNDAKIQSISQAKFSWGRPLELPRIWIAHQVQNLWPRPISSLALGLLLGTRESFSQQTLSGFQRSGITHIIALSGFNITILIFFLEGLMLRFFVTKKIRLWLIVGGVIFFTVFVGAGASITRAAIMGSIALSAKYWARNISPLRLILITAAVMSLFNPFILQYDLGFQLSLLSTVGLVYLTPLFEKIFIWMPNVLALKESLTTTLAATLATLPLIIYQFEMFSLVSPLANMLILPLIPYLMAFSAAAVFLNPVFDFLASVPAYFVSAGSLYLLTVSSFLGRQSWSVAVIHFPIHVVAFSYALIFSLMIYAKKTEANL